MLEYLLIPLIPTILLLILALPLIFIYLFIRLTEEAFLQIGFGPWHASLMVFGSILGSMVDLPLLAQPVYSYPGPLADAIRALDLSTALSFHPVTIAVNLGGCLLPMIISIDIIRRKRVSLEKAVAGTLFVAIVTYQAAVPVPSEGIVLPVYLSPVLAAFAGLVLARGYQTAPSLAYISGSMGTLIGADILKLLTPGTLYVLSPPGIHEKPLMLSIGGAGVFDGIFLTGVLAVLLAAMISCIFRGSECKSKPSFRS